MKVLHGFQIIRPRYSRDQEGLFDWLAEVHSETVPQQRDFLRKLLSRYGCDARRIATRGFEIPDPSGDFWEADRADRICTSGRGAGLLERTRFFNRRAVERMEEFYPVAGEDPRPDHLVHVTCTGYASPSAAQTIVDRRGWAGRTTVTHAYHMGCYASLPAVRVAMGLVATEGGRADIVHNEYCSLHLDQADHSPEQLVIQSLFADGNIKYSVSEVSEEERVEGRGHGGPGLAVARVRERIVPGTLDRMSWITGEWGMRMTLSRDVPAAVGASVAPFIDELLVGSGLSPGEARERAIFAIHPGGPRIIDSIQEILSLREAQVAHSKSVLQRYGNMSSATLPHVWSDLVRDPSIEAGRPVVSLAFGPGLTIFGALMRKCE